LFLCNRIIFALIATTPSMGSREIFSKARLPLKSNLATIFIFVGLWMTCLAASPKITEFTYRMKQLELLDSVLDAITVTAKFDQEVFHNVTCTDPTEQEPAIFTPCCIYSNVSGCVTSDVTCLDFAHPSLNNSIVYNQFINYFTHVANYATCHSITIDNHSNLGKKYKKDIVVKSCLKPL